MPELRKVSGEEAIKALQRLGFERIRQRGSHVILKKSTPGGAVGCTIPLHRELKIGTLRGILKQAPKNSANISRSTHSGGDDKQQQAAPTHAEPNNPKR